MKASQLKNIIRSIVKEELEKSFKKELQSSLIEIITNSTKNTSSVSNESIVTENKKKSIDEISYQTPKKELVRYTTNEVLNEILNQTSGGVPQEGSMVGMMGTNDLNRVQNNFLNESVSEVASEEVKGVANIINKDFSSLMKAIDRKKGL